MRAKVLNRLNELEAFAELIKSHVTVLRKELEVGGASSGSARKGKPALDEKAKAQLLSKIQKKRIKKATR